MKPLTDCSQNFIETTGMFLAWFKNSWVGSHENYRLLQKKVNLQSKLGSHRYFVLVSAWWEVSRMETFTSSVDNEPQFTQETSAGSWTTEKKS